MWCGGGGEIVCGRGEGASNFFKRRKNKVFINSFLGSNRKIGNSVVSEMAKYLI